MDERKDRDALNRKIPQIGDLVMITNHVFDYTGNNTEVMYGIIVNNQYDDEQLKIFPEVNVYLIKSGKIVPIPIGGVEIISHCRKTL